MSLDILFIHPNASKKIYQELSKDHSAHEPPIWAGMLANHCKSKNFKTAILDCEVNKLDYEKSAKEINNFKPKIACFVVYGQQPSASSQNMEGATKTSIELKKLNNEIKTLFVGGHVAALPKETLLKESSIDFVALNEGVYSISNLLSADNLNEESYLKKIKGIGFRNNENQIIFNSPGNPCSPSTEIYW